MEGCDGNLSKAPVPKKSRPIPDIPEITLPFPPLITARDIFEKSLGKNQNKSSSNVSKNFDYAGKKAPNKFLIYRKIFVEELHRQNIHYSLTDISRFIAKKWNQEPKQVQSEYSRIASEVDILRKQHFGIDSRKKSKKGQLRTFSAPVNNVNNTYPIANDIYGNVGNVANIQEQLDPSHIFQYGNAIEITDANEDSQLEQQKKRNILEQELLDIQKQKNDELEREIMLIKK